MSSGPALVERAIAADIAGDFPTALQLYTDAINLIASDLKKTSDPVVHALLRTRVYEYLARAEDLKVMIGASCSSPNMVSSSSPRTQRKPGAVAAAGNPNKAARSQQQQPQQQQRRGGAREADVRGSVDHRKPAWNSTNLAPAPTFRRTASQLSSTSSGGGGEVGNVVAAGAMRRSTASMLGASRSNNNISTTEGEEASEGGGRMSTSRSAPASVMRKSGESFTAAPASNGSVTERKPGPTTAGGGGSIPRSTAAGENGTQATSHSPNSSSTTPVEGGGAAAVATAHAANEDGNNNHDDETTPSHADDDRAGAAAPPQPQQDHPSRRFKWCLLELQDVLRPFVNSVMNKSKGAGWLSKTSHRGADLSDLGAEELLEIMDVYWTPCMDKQLPILSWALVKELRYFVSISSRLETARDLYRCMDTCERLVMAVGASNNGKHLDQAAEAVVRIRDLVASTLPDLEAEWASE